MDQTHVYICLKLKLDNAIIVNILFYFFIRQYDKRNEAKKAITILERMLNVRIFEFSVHINQGIFI